jgi:hypothetical protein
MHEDISRWAESHSISGQIAVAELVLWSGGRPGYELPPIVLYEKAADELRRLLVLDEIARTGSRITEIGHVEELCLAALRLRHVERSDGLKPFRGRPHPKALVRALAAMRRLVRTASVLVGDYTWLAAKEVDSGLKFGTAEETETGEIRGDNARRIGESVGIALSVADNDLGAVERRLIEINAERAAHEASRDAFTLADEFVFICLPGSYPSTIHVRIFRPPDGACVIVLGDLADNMMAGVAAGATKIAKQLIEHRPALDTENAVWIHYRPAEFAEYTKRQPDADDPESVMLSVDWMRRIVFADGFTSATFVNIPFGELTGLVDGPIRRWHAADYAVPTLVAMGVRVVDHIHRPFERGRPDTIQMRCRRWFCGVIFDVPLGRIASAACPVCNSTAMQPIRVY